MSIKTYVDELEQIQIEIKRNNTRNKLLRARTKELEYNIANYLAEKGQHGLKYKGRAIIIENKERRPAKNKKQKQKDIISLFQELGVENPQEAYNLLQDTQKGETIEEQKIKFKKIPNLY